MSASLASPWSCATNDQAQTKDGRLQTAGSPGALLTSFSSLNSRVLLAMRHGACVFPRARESAYLPYSTVRGALARSGCAGERPPTWRCGAPRWYARKRRPTRQPVRAHADRAPARGGRQRYLAVDNLWPASWRHCWPLPTPAVLARLSSIKPRGRRSSRARRSPQCVPPCFVCFPPAVPPLSHALLGPPLTHSRVSHLRQGTLFDLIYLYGALPELTAYSWGSLLLISASALSAPRLPGRPLQ